MYANDRRLRSSLTRLARTQSKNMTKKRKQHEKKLNESEREREREREKEAKEKKNKRVGGCYEGERRRARQDRMSKMITVYDSLRPS